jgi:hypothetical protein
METSISGDNSFLRIQGRIWSRLTRPKRAAILEEAFQYWRAQGFPYYRLTKRQMSREFARLKTKDWRPILSGKNLPPSNTGLQIANVFQPGMWKARVHRYRTPMDVFQNDELLRKAIERALRLWPDRYGANASCLRLMLKTFPDTASVYNYRPMVAKAVIGKYSHDGPVVDFSAGYGGRLLGALALNRSYIGIEPNCGQIAGFRRMMSALTRLGFLLPKVDLLRGVAEKELLGVPTKSAELVFSSPPFFNWERYSKSYSQSYRRFPKYEMWRRSFLESVIAESYRILTNGGHFALNVSNGNRLPSVTDVRTAARRAGFRLLTSHRVGMPRVPYLHPRNGGSVKTELLLVFRK